MNKKTLSIKDQRAAELAHEVAKMMGGTMTQAVIAALEEKRDRERHRRPFDHKLRVEEMLAIARRCAAAPLLDDRSEDDILGYDELGIPSR